MENGVKHNNLTKNNVKIVIHLRRLSNFWRNLNIPLINCEVESILTWFILLFMKLIIQKMNQF